MTKEEILNMPAGRELDALVAEKVMGYIAWTEKRGEYTYVVFQKPGDKEPYMRSRNWKAEMIRYKRIQFNEIDYRMHVVMGIPEFSTDISAAWEVVERFHDVSVKRYETMGGHRYACKIEIGSFVSIASGDTAPESICKTALLAVLDVQS